MPDNSQCSTHELPYPCSYPATHLQLPPHGAHHRLQALQAPHALPRRRQVRPRRRRREGGRRRRQQQRAVAAVGPHAAGLLVVLQGGDLGVHLRTEQAVGAKAGKLSQRPCDMAWGRDLGS